MFTKELLKEKHVGGFETLYVYQIKKKKSLINLNKKEVKNISFFAKGKRGMIFTGNYQGKKLGIKIKNPHSEVDSVKHESNMLKKVNELDIAPNFVFSNDDLVAYEFFEGVVIEEWTINNEKKEIITMLKETFKQLRVLDENILDKKEMSHPHKHVLVDEKGKVCLIDFERARNDLTPSNVTGFAQFITSTNYGALLKEKGISLIDQIKDLLGLCIIEPISIGKDVYKEILDEREKYKKSDEFKNEVENFIFNSHHFCLTIILFVKHWEGKKDFSLENAEKELNE